jgi:hypothetical protein
MRYVVSTVGTFALLLVLPSVAAAAAPSDLLVTDLRASGATLTWKAPSDGSQVYGYNIVNLLDPYVNNGVGFSFTTTGEARLEPNRRYRLAVVATYVDRPDSARSAPVEFTSPGDTTPPAAPTAREFFHTATSVTLAWMSGGDDVGVDSFLISGGGRTWTVPAWHQWSRELAGLETNRTHTFTVRARDAAGNVSAPSNAVSVAIENQPPTAPGNLREGGEGLLWDAASDNSGAIETYWVFVDGAASPLHGTYRPTSPLQVWDDSLMEFLPAPGTHTYTVRARDTSGNLGPPSNALTVVVR